MTNFAVLTSTSSTSTSKANALAIETISYAGLAISIPCLVLTIAVYSYFNVSGWFSARTHDVLVSSHPSQTSTAAPVR